MNVDPLDLARHFHALSNDELCNQCSSGDLTELAQSIADAELSVRGLVLPAPQPAPGSTEPSDSSFETVAQFLSPTDAYVMAACLKAAGITAVVADANLVQANYLLAIAVGGVRILVPASRAAEAREVIAAFNRGEYALPDDDDAYRA